MSYRDSPCQELKLQAAVAVPIRGNILDVRAMGPVRKGPEQIQTRDRLSRCFARPYGERAPSVTRYGSC